VAAEGTFAALLEADLRKQQIEAEVVNAGGGGGRTDQTMKRLDQAVPALKPRIVLVMYGANDSYVDRDQKEPRLSVEQFRDNLKELVAAVGKGGVEVVLMTPPRWGRLLRCDIARRPAPGRRGGAVRDRPSSTRGWDRCNAQTTPSAATHR
jgi:lysophospholipase L1-like esterase